MRKWIFGLGVPALLIAGFVGYWFYLESQLRAFVEGWIEDQREAGTQVSHGAITTGGFPLSVYAEIPAPSITTYAGQDMMTWQGETLRISFPPWDFLTYRFDSPGEHLIAMVGTDALAKWSLNAEQATGSWAIGANGAGTLTLDLGDVAAVDVLGQAFGLKALQAEVGFAAQDAPETEPRVAATAQVEGLELPEFMTAPFPPKIDSMHTEISLRSPIMPSSLPLLYLVLRDYDGQIAIDNTTLHWGELEIATTGALRVDEANYLTGQFPTRIVGYQDMIDRLQDAGMVDNLQAVGMNAVAGTMTETGTDGRPTLTLDISLTDGFVKAQDFMLMQMEPVPVAGAGS